MFKVSTVLVASMLVSSVSFAQALKTAPRTRAEVKTSTGTSAKPIAGKSSKKTATQQATEFNAATCSASEFANELARRGQGDSAAIERQMKLIGVGMGMCSAETGGLLGKKEDGTPNYTDSQLANLVKILAQTEIEYSKNKSQGLLAAEEAAYAIVMDQDNNITAEEKATAKEAINAFRTHCKIFANN